jgi:CHASE3 domain sensor protein
VIVVTAAGFALLATSTRLGAAERTQTYTLDAAQSDTATLLGLYVDQETGLRGYLLDRQQLFLQPYLQAETAIPAAESRLSGTLHTVAGAPTQLQAVTVAYQAWHNRYATPTLNATGTGRLDPTAAAAQAEAEAGKTLFDAIRDNISALNALLDARQAANEATIRHLQNQLEALLVAVLATLAAGTAGVAFTMRTRVIRPLDRLTASTRRVAEGQLRAEVTVNGPRELRTVARDVDTMRYRLVEQINRARLAGEALLHDGPTVAALSDALAARKDQLPGLTAIGRLDPAEGVLAGDWYDLIRVDDKLAVIVGDVSGHGPRSAVLALRLRSVLTATLASGAKPGVALGAAASHLADDPPEHFATVFVAVVDPATDTLNYASAGHPAAILHPTGAQSDWQELAPTGPLLSPIVALWSWSTRTVPFRPGDGMLAYTDGIIEGRNANNEEYGIDRLKHDLETATPPLPADIVNHIAAKVTAFVGGSQTDDRTLVYCQRHAKPSSPQATSTITEP